MSDAFEPPVLPEGAPWRCPYCGESYQFQTHPGCLKKALEERDAARAVAIEVAETLQYDAPPSGKETFLMGLRDQHPWFVPKIDG